ncbi:MAG: protein-L-isoaspartate O-methyltransferase, partial [Pseudomonadota bacterium]
ERYVPTQHRGIAYSDEALVIASDEAGRPLRAMTRPAILGRLLQLAQIKDDDVVLLVGAGLGYTAAILGELASSVIALECDDTLANAAQDNLEAGGVDNAVVVTGTLEEGYAKEAPYDQIFVDGAAQIAPAALEEQLKVGGRMVAVHGKGLAGRARLTTRGEHGFASRDAFNASLDTLPGFVPAPTFVF